MPISPPPLRRWRPEYIPAYLSNGLIGLRAGPIPLIEGVAIVSGLAAVDPVEKGEGFGRAPYPIGGDLEIDGAKLSRLPRQAELVEQRYDFANGELTSRFEGGEGVERHREEHDELAPLSTSYAVDARPERSYVLHQFISLVPSQAHHEPHRQATRLVGMAARRGFETLRDENRGAWEQIWKGRIR